METPNVPISFVPAQAGEVLTFGAGIKCRIQEGQSIRTFEHETLADMKTDGSNTDNRMGSAEFKVPPNTRGPPPHWHEMHDETFLVTKGTVRFHARDGKQIDAKVGDLVVVPPRAPHTFENATSEEAVFVNVFTPAFYIQYFKLMDTWAKQGVQMDKAMGEKARAYFATIGVDGPL